MRLGLFKVTPDIASRVTVFGCLQFLLCSTVAMFFYGGGTAWDAGASGYTFWHNFFSDLGRTVSYAGVPNRVAEPLFNTSLIIHAVTLIYFYIVYPSLLSKKKFLRLAVTLAGVLSAIGLIRVGLNPDDIRPEQHMAGVWLWGIPLFLVMITTIGDGIWGRSLSRKELLFTGGFAFILAAHIYQGLSDLSGPAVPAMQKIVVYYNITWFLVMSRLLRKESSRK
ncbi:MAG: hypothetical protein QF613_06450 [Candidatus Marinimicrobia bacterium]|jgi:hypothetical membrane protein|nr:hypothetical protein [Candidatus Neomarinimicrobiota bacterium]MDP6836110.1 hypothetical protein [Candidatus Neomarinimicrobiota bacterium]|tara:strand:- start:790 stop:1458 length:669 start_codon:yes stop_codon:yes gene_type:complete